MGALLGLALPGPSLLYRALAVVLLFVGVLTYGYVKGISHEQNKQLAAQAANATKSVEVSKAQNAVNAGTYKRLEETLTNLEDRYRKLRKGIPSHVSKTDHTCKLSNGWVLLHDAAAGGTVPGAPTIAEANPSSVTAVEALEEAIVPNYQEYNKCREQVIELNRWYEDQRKIYERATKH